MTKLIGTNPNQVPSNADLGSAAFMDKKEFLLSKGSDISAADAVIPKTAVDVFIYDTSKDSDGGAWRKRTQHTSWYNERLNTTTRGSRREFPAVAVIIAESDKITIYDGDDPDLPMWMVFEDSATVGNKILWLGNVASISSLTMLNGNMVFGATQSSQSYTSLYQVNFISEYVERYTSSTQKRTWNNDIQRRNSGSYSSAIAASIVSTQVNDVAMTVLPNAPIDASTGLPVPTIAVATLGGISYIHNDGTVIDNAVTSTTNYRIRSIDFDGYDRLIMNFANNSSDLFGTVMVLPIPYADTSDTYEYQFDNIGFYSWANTITNLPVSAQNSYHIEDTEVVGDRSYKFGANVGLQHIEHVDTALKSGIPSRDITTAMFAQTSSDYATGYQVGDIKLATLSDTDAADVTRSNIVSITSFTAGTGGSVSTSGTQLTITQVSGSNGRAVSPTFSTELGKKYMFIAEGVSSTGGGGFRTEVRGPELVNNLFTGTSYTVFDGTGGSIYVELYCMGGVGASVTYDNISVEEVEADRSVNGIAGVGNNGLQVFGTVTKNPVATGADLVGYSGFDTTPSLLLCPFNSDFAFGNNDYSASIWFKNGGTNELLINSSDGTSQVWGIRIHTNDKLLIQVTDDSFVSRSIINTGPEVADVDAWQMVTLTRTNNTLNLYLDGKYLGSGSAVEANLSNPHRIIIGAENGSGAKAFSGSLALARISGTVPSDEQIKKMYEDEKMLFQENAKATLYGSSSSVTAVTYDDNTNLLHVGTSAGRSVFQGLRRIDNTTDAVGAAISASNGMVAED